jgi:hypothetical protein
MLNSIKLKIIIILVMLSVVFWAKTKQSLVEIKPSLLELPAMNYCSCDSATYCLNDEEVMQLHMWYESVKYFMRSQD